jgi:hypothetical protein
MFILHGNVRDLAADPYQPAERRYERTRAILEVSARERGCFLGITTKSDLILRDLRLRKEIARRRSPMDRPPRGWRHSSAGRSRATSGRAIPLNRDNMLA